MNVIISLVTCGLALGTRAAPLLATDPPQNIAGNNFALPGHNATYDYVVVGGGTGGLALAYRLAEDGTKTVAVVEAGGFYELESGNLSVVPAYNQEYDYVTPDYQWYNPLADWGFLTTPQAGAMNQTYHYGRGKMLGGCSAENGLNYNRPTKGCLQAWADAVGDSSYIWDEFLPFFAQSTNYTPPNTDLRAPNATVPENTASAETRGPLHVAYPNWAAPLSSWAQLAFRQIGIQDVNDLISGQLIGSQYGPLTINPTDQSRSSSQTSYLDEALRKGLTNLQVYTHTLAKQVLFDENKNAYGVVARSGISPQNFFLTATEEVILSAGAFQSPQLLMVSGIGSAEQLSKYEIPVVADRPGVGQGMWDHVVLSVAYQVNVGTYGRLMNATIAADAVLEYTNHTGILTNDMSDYLGWEKLPASSRSALSVAALNDLAQFPADWPEIEHEVSSGPFGSPSLSTPESPIDVGYIQPVLIAPLSRGSITIASADMADPPVIDPGWLTHPTDQEVAVAAFKRGREFFNASAITPILIADELLPGQDLPVGSSDEQILAYWQKNLGHNWHASCTNKMGKIDDPMAVVDSRARVIGVNRLRVVDASAFPVLPPGHPTATVYALAEKIAADILNGTRHSGR